MREVLLRVERTPAGSLHIAAGRRALQLSAAEAEDLRQALQYLWDNADERTVDVIGPRRRPPVPR